MDFIGLNSIDEYFVSGYDIVMVTCAHTNVDYDMIQRNSKAIFDTKNAMNDVKNRENIEVL